jgi:5-methylthioadenosine/S-adenosylhomocysteine deaminase
MTIQPTTVIRNADWVVAWDQTAGTHRYLRGADVGFAGDRITHVGTSPAAATEIDGSGLVVMPGLVDLHAHPSSEPLLKGLTDEVGSANFYMSSLYEYLPLFENDGEGKRAAVEVALSELLMSGVTTVCDLSMEHEHWFDTCAASGLRVFLAPMFRSGRWLTEDGKTIRYEWNEKAGRQAFDSALRLIDRARQHPSGRLDGMVTPAQVDTCTADLLADAAAESRSRKLPLQIHAAQSPVEVHEMIKRHGKTSIAWLDELGVLGAQTTIGHGIFLDHHSWMKLPTRDDLGRLARSGTSVAHCPTVFSRRGIVLEHFGAYRAAGVNLGIGTDTFPHNMVEEMRTAGIAARIAAGDVHSVRANDLFHAATVGGAKALGRDDIGRIAPGMKADLVLIDATHPAMRPLYDPVRSLIYSAGERAVRDVYVDGVPMLRDGRVLAFDYENAVARLEEAQKRALPRVPGRDWARRPASEIMPPTFD